VDTWQPRIVPPTGSPVAQIRALHDRLVKAEQPVANGKVHPVYGMANHYLVEGSNARYLVNGECVCPDVTNRADLVKEICKHRLASMVYTEQQVQRGNAPAKAKTTDEDLAQKVEELYH
jgi:hypothetical protein